MKTLTFTNGDQMPIIGLGTWKSDPGEVYEAVLTALRAGYRHIDCAPIYGNEKEVGKAFTQAFDEGVLEREELWVTSKLWNNAHRQEDVVPALKQTLADLRLDYLDLWLIHWPVALKPEAGFPKRPDDFLSLEEVPITQTWKGMEEALESGLTKHIGVSNFHLERVQDLVKNCRNKPELNQVELHPYLPQNELVQGCKDMGMHLTAYSPLGSRDRSSIMKKDNEPILFDHPVINAVAEKHNCTVGQVLISWAVHRETAVIPKSTNAGRIQENLNAKEVALDKEDMEKIGGIEQEYRFVDGSFWTMEGSPYSMQDLWG